MPLIVNTILARYAAAGIVTEAPLRRNCTGMLLNVVRVSNVWILKTSVATVVTGRYVVPPVTAQRRHRVCPFPVLRADFLFSMQSSVFPNTQI
jgi:hypothetical protein